MAIAGKVAITLSTENGGAWSADVTYDRLVAVKHNNNLYISRKTVANVEPPNDEFWFLALEGFSGEDIEKIISGETVVGNANLLEGLTAEQVGASGARNLIPYPYYETTHTDNGITWTDNGDGTVTANGTATAASGFYMTPTSGTVFKKGTYKISGSENPSYSTYRIQFFNSDWSKYANEAETGIVTLDEDTAMQLRIHVASGVTVNNLTFRPMLELGSVAHDYVPYHFGGAEDALSIGGKTASEFYNLGEVEVLPEGADLDTYITAGQWGTDTDAIAQSIINKPESVTSKFRLKVEYTTRSESSNYVRQTIQIANSGTEYERTSSAGVFKEWTNKADGGNAKTLDGHGAEYFAPADEIFSVNFIERHFKANTETELDEYLINLHTNAKEGDWYRGVVRCDVVHSIFGGFTYYVEGFKWTPNFGYQKMTSYTDNGRTFERAIYSGTWGDWRKSANITDLANYLQLDGGGKVSGANVNPIIINSTSSDDMVRIPFQKSGTTRGFLGFVGTKPAFTDANYNYYELLHTGNKPSGSYTGNGDATGRTISVGGIGNCLMVRRVSSEDFAIVTESGYIGKIGGTVVCGADAYYSRGGQHLYMATVSELFNASGGSYYYELL